MTLYNRFTNKLGWKEAKADLKLGCKYTRKAPGEDIRTTPRRIVVLILPQKYFPV